MTSNKKSLKGKRLIMYSARTGQCRSYNMITNLATPFVKSACFEPAYIAQMNDNNSDEPRPAYQSAFNITNDDSTCGFDAFYGKSIQNRIDPLKMASFDSRNSVWRREHSVIVNYAPRDYKTPKGETCPQQPYYAVDETGKSKVVCPILTAANVKPQCQSCMTTVFQCEQFKEIDPVAHRRCEDFKRMIHYDIVTPNGQLIPMAVEMDGEGFDVYKAAMQKCAFQCGNCVVNYPSMNYATTHCQGPNYSS